MTRQRGQARFRVGGGRHNRGVLMSAPRLNHARQTVLGGGHHNPAVVASAPNTKSSSVGSNAIQALVACDCVRIDEAHACASSRWLRIAAARGGLTPVLRHPSRHQRGAALSATRAGLHRWYLHGYRLARSFGGQPSSLRRARFAPSSDTIARVSMRRDRVIPDGC